MKRKRLTQVFPFLLPIRKWQRKKLFYLEMLIDGNKYAKNKSEALLPNTVFETSSLMLNENSGFDMKYQINKVHNLKLAARTINKVIITVISELKKETQLDMAGALSQSVAVKSQFCQSDMAMDFREVYRTVMAEC